MTLLHRDSTLRLPVPILKKYHSVRSTLLIEELDNLEKMYKAFRTSGAYRKRRHAYVLIDSPEEVLPTNPSALKRCRLTPTTLKRAIDDSGREERRSKRQRLGEAEAAVAAPPAVVVAAAAPPAVVPVAINQDEASNNVAEQERLAEDKKQRRKERELRRIESSLGPKWKVTVSSKSGLRRSSRVRKQTVFFRDLVW